MTGTFIKQVRAAFLRGDVRGAEAMLRDRLAVSPEDNEVRIELARLLRHRGRFVESLAALDRVAMPEGAWAAPLLRASILTRLGRHEEAVEVQRYALAHESQHPRALLGLSHLLKTVGEIEEAAAVARQALERDPRLGEAWWSLSNLKTVDFSEDDRSAMQALLSGGSLDDETRMYLHFALARAFDSTGDADQSWDHLAKANAIRAAQVRHRPESIAALVDATIAIMNADFFSARAGWGVSSAAPIFIVGMPRAGSTLLEQMLASHSQVEGTIELPDIPALTREIAGMERLVDRRYLDRLCTYDANAVRALGETYLERTKPHRRLGRPFFIDKMPNNWLFAGFIHLILPNAKIIDMRRHPLDCGLSNFRELFAGGQTYSYDLAHIGHYYADYVRLMRHFDAAQPGLVHRVIYDRLVDEPERELRGLVEYLGLPFEEPMLRFYDTKRGVRTASAAQVRQPLNRKGMGQWRRYEAQLGPLRESLGDTLEHWNDDQAAAGTKR